MPRSIDLSTRPRGQGRPLLIQEYSLADVLTPAFQGFLQQGHELVGDGSVDEAVVIAEREVYDRADGDGVVAIFVGEHHRLLGDSSYAHDRAPD